MLILLLTPLSGNSWRFSPSFIMDWRYVTARGATYLIWRSQEHSWYVCRRLQMEGVSKYKTWYKYCLFTLLSTKYEMKCFLYIFETRLIEHCTQFKIFLSVDLIQEFSQERHCFSFLSYTMQQWLIGFLKSGHSNGILFMGILYNYSYM